MQPTNNMTTFEKESNEAVEVSIKQKVTKRQPCPCGSGKKFKSCCIDDPRYELVLDVAPPPTGQPPKLTQMGKAGPVPRSFGKQAPKAFQNQRQSNTVHHRRV